MNKEKELMGLLYDPTVKTSDAFLKRMGEYLNVLATKHYTSLIQPFTSK